MRWFLAALAFAAVVGLAVGTAAIEAENVQQRQRMQRIADQLESARVALVAETLVLRRKTSLPELVRHWLRLQALLDAEGRS